MCSFYWKYYFKKILYLFFTSTLSFFKKIESNIEFTQIKFVTDFYNNDYINESSKGNNQNRISHLITLTISQVYRISHQALQNAWRNARGANVFCQIRRGALSHWLKKIIGLLKCVYCSVIRSRVKLTPRVIPRGGWPCIIWWLHPPIVSSAKHSPRRQNGNSNAKVRMLRVRVSQPRIMPHIRISLIRLDIREATRN